MGLRCLIGHDFGELQTERDRRERGEEVIVTIREYRACSRCGETRVVSENKEVRTAVEAGADADDEPAGSDEPDAPASDVEADADDGVILEDEPEPAAERQRGEWPASDEGGEEPAAEEPTPWPAVEGEDEGYAAEVGDGGPAEGVEFGGSLTPEASPAAGEAAGEDVVEATREGGFRRATPGPSPTARQRTGGTDTEFYCPECEFTTPTADSSLRPGDICPECRLGYLTERDRSAGR